jgi:hypothetical protein
VDVARQAGYFMAYSVASANLALTGLVAGEWEEALGHADDATSEAALAELVRARVALARGGEWHLPSELTDPDYGGDDLSLRAYQQVLQALDALVRGRPAGPSALQAAETAYAIGQLYDDFTVVWQVATEVAWSDGDRAALASLLAIVDGHRGGGVPMGVRAQRSRIAGLVAAAAGDDAEAEQRLRDAVAEAQQWHSDPTVALCRADLAAVLQRQGRTEEAAEQAALAQETFARLGATRWAAEQISA